MAHYCPDCRQIFQTRMAICPQCGLCGVSDDQPEQTYLDMGYSRFGSVPQRPTADPAPAAAKSTVQVTIDDADLIEQLRSGFHTYADNLRTGAPASQQRSNTQQQNNSGDFFGSYADPQHTPAQSTRSAQPTVPTTPDHDDFFGSYSSNTPQQPESLRQPAAGMRPPETNRRRTQNTGHGNYRVPGATGNGLRRFFTGLGNFFAEVPWRVVFYIALVVAVIAILYSLWQMRAAIVSSIMGFLISLIPTVLLVVAIVWLIRSMFR